MPSLFPLQPPHLRRANRTSILRYVRANGAVTRPQIADAIGLSRPTVAKLVDELVAEGLIRGVGLGHSTSSGGKRPGLVELNADAAAVLAVAVGVETVEVGVTDLSGKILLRRQVPTGAAAGPAAVVERTCALAREVLGEHTRSGGVPVLGAGVGAPGIVHPATGVVAFSPNLPGWREVPLGQSLSRATGLHVTVDNECRTQTLGEVWFGNGENVANLVGLETGVGIGAGVVLDGQIYRGPDDAAGEIGHTTVDPLGAQCHCGNMGCWEVYASTTALLQWIRDALWRGEYSVLRERVGNNLEALTVPMVLSAVAAGDSLARRYAVDEMGYRLGLGVANLVNIFNPELVVLFGEITSLGEDLFEKIRMTVRTRAMPQAARRVQVRASALGRDADLVGAATLVISQLFAVDRFSDGQALPAAARP